MAKNVMHFETNEEKKDATYRLLQQQEICDISKGFININDICTNCRNFNFSTGFALECASLLIYGFIICEYVDVTLTKKCMLTLLLAYPAVQL
jgi:hypothetical protein